ncbi:Ribonuclease Z [Seminavis robusta]|uniref:Ribonuclease Z n=1 Tax=Seminavis robusta TaxID=568900 RepID=A0A9N8H9I9_9STRA|nr:Ribonuclease Z [Seminavis robusta]|eukprot:Sro207_g086950.1 Ribonuclease Z (707) ;mRNA; f:75253-77785
MNVNIWGCRGSIARSHPELITYGGNTPCVEVVVRGGDADNSDNSDGEEGQETRIVLDMGSGAYDLGQKLVKLGPLKDHHILLTHCHWDHIQGFPFFAPFFIPQSEWHIHAPGGFTSSLKEKLASQMSYEFFPLSIDMLGASIDYHELTEGTLTLGAENSHQVLATCQFLNHPVLTLGYRLESTEHGASMAYITDHEPFNRAFATEGYKRNTSVNPNDGSNTTAANGDDRHVDFLKNVDLLIHDAQYTAEEYKGKTGWGHGTIEYVVDIAMAAEVKTLVLFHHDPQRTDEQVDRLVQLAQERVRQANSTLQVMAAADRKEIYVPPKKDIQSVRDSMASMDLSASSALTKPIQEGASKREILVSCRCSEEVFADLAEDGIEVTFYPQDNNGNLLFPQRDDPFRASKLKKWSLVMISCNTKYKDCKSGVELCRRLRQSTTSCGEIPILLVAKDREELKRYQEDSDDAGVTDWIVEPFTPAYMRTRIRMGVSRSPCRWVPPEIPQCELLRRASLEELGVAKEKETRFDAIIELARISLGVAGVSLNLVEADYHWTKSFSCPMFAGIELPNVPRDVSMCSHTILQKDLLVINDTRADGRFADNPQVADGVKVRFYAGCPIPVPHKNGGEYNVGTLCATDFRPRKFDEREKDMLRKFAWLVRRELLACGASAKNGASMPIAVVAEPEAARRPDASAPKPKAATPKWGASVEC